MVSINRKGDYRGGLNVTAWRKDGRRDYLSGINQSWVDDLEVLAELAPDEAVEVYNERHSTHMAYC